MGTKIVFVATVHLITETKVPQFDPQIMVGLPWGTQVAACDSGLLASNTLSQLIHAPKLNGNSYLLQLALYPGCEHAKQKCLLNLEYYSDLKKKNLSIYKHLVSKLWAIIKSFLYEI